MFLKCDIKNSTRQMAALMLAIVLIILSSCSSSKKVPYFKDVPDSLGLVKEIDASVYTEPKIMANDLLNISIQTIDPQTTEVLNKPGSGISTSSSGVPTYLVDKDGYIEMPMVGRVQLGGLTIADARERIREKAKKYFVEPVVNVRFANFYITMLGELSNPGRLTIPNEKISIVDAIGMASDLAISGMRNNILLIREENGKRIFVRYDLNSSNIFNSPYFYLKSGDIIYVQQTKVKARTGTTDYSRDRYITYATSALSLFLSFYSIVILSRK